LFVGDCDFYLAGPERFVDAAAAALRSAAVPEAQIRGMLV
jgi:ferredoxin-NADP reductase